MIRKLLPLGGSCPEQGSAAAFQIPALFVQLPVNEEVFLFRPHRGDDPAGVRIAEQPQHPQCLSVDGVHGTEQGGLFVQRLAPVGAEHRGDI